MRESPSKIASCNPSPRTSRIHDSKPGPLQQKTKEVFADAWKTTSKFTFTHMLDSETATAQHRSVNQDSQISKIEGQLRKICSRVSAETQGHIVDARNLLLYRL
ncbi:hypothetical protein V6Z11_D08G183200 [Gossypium hirsutum]